MRRDLFEELLKSVKEMKAIEAGWLGTPSRVKTHSRSCWKAQFPMSPHSGPSSS